MNNVIVYTRDNCTYCTQAKMLLQSKGQSYREMKIGADLTREEFISLFPEQKSVPFVIINGEKIGGYSSLVEWCERPEQQFLAE